MPAISDYAWVDGRVVARETAAPSVASSSFHMGTGVFDGLMAYWNDDHWHLHLADRHLERFVAGCERMRLPFSWSAGELEEGVRELLDICPETTHYVRPIAFRGGPEIRLVPSREMPVTVCIFATEACRGLEAPLSCGVSSFRRVSSRAIPISWKVCGAYANSFLAQTEALEQGHDTAVMMDEKGNLSEASVSNLFLIQGERLVTPALSGDVFPGLTRGLLIDLAEGMGLAVDEREVKAREIEGFDGAFLCSTLMEVRPVARVGSHRFRWESHPVFQALANSFRELTER
ncbi:MAG TPA: aminotransferase class IV [Solirubrobacterales bacterium]|nr:aminotransferase class IV [Solirubrobacterales bacterium]